MKAIEYYSETDKDYVKALKKVHTLNDLKSFMLEYDDLVADAKQIVDKMNEKEFQKFIKNRNKENKGIFSNSETTSVIMMPEKMFKISAMATQYKVPFGLVYIRLKEHNQ